MDFETELPCFVVTYKELLERRKKLLEKLSTLGSTNAGSFIAETEETHVCSGVHNRFIYIKNKQEKVDRKSPCACSIVVKDGTMVNRQVNKPCIHAKLEIQRSKCIF